jgi:hypothetical protein
MLVAGNLSEVGHGHRSRFPVQQSGALALSAGLAGATWALRRRLTMQTSQRLRHPSVLMLDVSIYSLDLLS